MRQVELSIDENNRAAAIRNAIFDAKPEECLGCEEAFEICYSIGQIARKGTLSPEEAASWAWGNIGVCCKQTVTIEEIPVQILSASERILVAA